MSWAGCGLGGYGWEQGLQGPPTWVVLGEAREGLRGVHAHIVFGEDDLAVQHAPRTPRPGVEGQEVRGF